MSKTGILLQHDTQHSDHMEMGDMDRQGREQALQLNNKTFDGTESGDFFFILCSFVFHTYWLATDEWITRVSRRTTTDGIVIDY